MSASSLRSEVEKFKVWAAEYPATDRTGEWECNYPAWDKFYTAVVNFIETASPADWTVDSTGDVLFAIARDNECEDFARVVAKDEDLLLRLSAFAVSFAEVDAKWQLADRLGAIKDHHSEAESLLLQLVNDPEEYVSRRALLSLGSLKSLNAEALAERAWTTGDQYQRIAALSVLRDIKSAKLPDYLQRAEEDGRTYLVQFAREIGHA